MADPRPYHHGDLRRALLLAAAEAVREVGPAAVSLRDVARRAGVSHAAPAHHFADKAGLLSALAAEGHRHFAATLREAAATGTFLDVGVAYVRFAITERAWFEVMFRPELLDPDVPELIEAQAASTGALLASTGEIARGLGVDELDFSLAAWSVAHGFAQLWLDGNLGDEPDPLGRARRVLALSLNGPGRAGGPC